MSSPSSTPTPTDTPSPASRAGSNLYLYTFLATLILLLVVSCTVLSRSALLRRRYRNAIARALEQGFVLAPPEQGSHKLAFGTKPQLHDVWLSDDAKIPHWADITPISAQQFPTVDGDLSKHPSKISLAASEASTTETLQVSVLVAMPGARRSDDLPEVALGVTQSQYPS
ncbi:hypothetical protein C8J57DRAFT_1280033 [Mycena rebaudengoi]|nr:hypothetical protein C8J57DRAFT_1280033 [Mycena rebaudengoi]